MIYQGWTSAADDQRLTDFARATYSLSNF